MADKSLSHFFDDVFGRDERDEEIRAYRKKENKEGGEMFDVDDILGLDDKRKKLIAMRMKPRLAKEFHYGEFLRKMKKADKVIIFPGRG